MKIGRRTIMMRFLVLAAAVTLAQSPALGQRTKAPPPTEPADHPDWAEARQYAESILRSGLYDPRSAAIEYVSGFQWSSTQLGFRKRRYGWVACVSRNAKNLFGAFTGAQRYFIAIDGETRRTRIKETWEEESICDTGPFAPLQPELMDTNTIAPTVSVADELAKLATLRDKGIITPAEFEAQKAKLLAKP